MQNQRGVDRREFLGCLLAAGILGLSAGSGLGQEAGTLTVESWDDPVLGKKLSRVALGGWALGEVLGIDEAMALINRADNLGIKVFDTAPTYGKEGRSERLLGEYFRGKRQGVVISSKTYQRTGEPAERELDESLKRLDTSYIDAWLFHEVYDSGDLEALAGPGGAVETARKALDDGRIRLLGASSHTSPEVLKELLDRVPEIQLVQCPVNCLDPHYKSFIKTVLPMTQERGIKVWGLEPDAAGSIAKIGTVKLSEAIRFALSQPVETWICDIESGEELESLARLLTRSLAMRGSEAEELLGRTRPFGGTSYESYKGWKN